VQRPTAADPQPPRTASANQVAPAQPHVPEPIAIARHTEANAKAFFSVPQNQVQWLYEMRSFLVTMPSPKQREQHLSDCLLTMCDRLAVRPQVSRARIKAISKFPHQEDVRKTTDARLVAAWDIVSNFPRNGRLVVFGPSTEDIPDPVTRKRYVSVPHVEELLGALPRTAAAECVLVDCDSGTLEDALSGTGFYNSQTAGHPLKSVSGIHGTFSNLLRRGRLRERSVDLLTATYSLIYDLAQERSLSERVRTFDLTLKLLKTDGVCMTTLDDLVPLVGDPVPDFEVADFLNESNTWRSPAARAQYMRLKADFKERCTAYLARSLNELMPDFHQNYSLELRIPKSTLKQTSPMSGRSSIEQFDDPLHPSLDRRGHHKSLTSFALRSFRGIHAHHGKRVLGNFIVSKSISYVIVLIRRKAAPAPEPRVVASAKPAPSPAIKSSRAFKNNDTVLIHGLTSDLGLPLNGCTGTIVGFSESKSRYRVSIPDNGIKLIKEQNLKQPESSDPDL